MYIGKCLFYEKRGESLYTIMMVVVVVVLTVVGDDDDDSPAATVQRT